MEAPHDWLKNPLPENESSISHVESSVKSSPIPKSKIAELFGKHMNKELKNTGGYSMPDKLMKLLKTGK